MSKLENAIVAIWDVFEEYTFKDKAKVKLIYSELGSLVMNQLSNPGFKSTTDRGDIDGALKKIDKNKDGNVYVHEFSQFVAHLATCYFQKKRGWSK